MKGPIANLIVVAGIAGVLAVGMPVAQSCALCADIPGASGPLDPHLLEIVSAIQHEIDSGGLEQADPGAPLPTSGRVLGRRVARLLEDAPERRPGLLELILIDSGARFLFDPADPDRGLFPVPDRAKQKAPQPAVRWVTGIDVFHALLERRLAVDTAVVRGILVIEKLSDGEGPLVAAPVGDFLGEQSAESAGHESRGKPATIIVLSVLVVLVAMPILLAMRSARTRVRRSKVAPAGTR